MRVLEGVVEIDDLDSFVARLGEIGEAQEVAIQAFDARYVAGREHLRVAVERANRAFERDEAIAEERAVEILCYAAGRRQIGRALEMGVSEGQNAVALVINGEDEAGALTALRELIEPEEGLAEARDPERIREFFGITDAETGATDASLEDLVIERVSLLVVEK